MPFLKSLLIALWWEIALTAGVAKDTDDCAAFPKEEASQGEHAMIQHSKPLKLVDALEQDMLPGSTGEEKTMPSYESKTMSSTGEEEAMSSLKLVDNEQHTAEEDVITEENVGSLDKVQNMAMEEKTDEGLMGEPQAASSLGSKYENTEKVTAEQDDVTNVGSLEKGQKVSQSSETFSNASQNVILDEEMDQDSMEEEKSVPSLGSKYSHTEEANAEQDDIKADVGSLKETVFQSSETLENSSQSIASSSAQAVVTDDLATQPVGACDWQCYLNRYPDVQETVGANNVAAAEEHWNSMGQKEGRDCTCDKGESFAVVEDTTQDVAATSLQGKVHAMDIMTSCEPWTEASQETLQAALRAYEESEKFEEKMTEASGESPATAGHVSIMKYLREKVLKPGFSVLELGCAAGGMLRLVRDEYDIGWAGVPYADPVPHDSLVGVELVAGWVKFAQKHLKNISVFEGDITEYSLPEPYSNKTFDLVMLNDVMGQVEKTRFGCFFSQLDKVTHSGSIVYMHAPSPSGLVANGKQGYDKENTVPHHFVVTGMATIGFELVSFEHDMDTVCGGEGANVPKQLEGAHCYQNGWPKYTHNVFRKVQDNTVLNLS